MERPGLLASPHHSHPNLHFYFWTAGQFQIHIVKFWNISKNYFEIKSKTSVKSGRINAFTNIFKISIGIKEGRGRNTWLLNPLGDKKVCNVFLFYLLCLPGYVLPSYYTCCFFTRALFWVIGWWRCFLYGMGVGEKQGVWGQKKINGRHCGRWSPGGKAELSAGEDKETQHKSTVNQPTVVLYETTCLKIRVSVVVATCVLY